MTGTRTEERPRAERFAEDVIDSIPYFIKATLPFEGKCTPPSLLAYNCAGIFIIVNSLLSLYGFVCLCRLFY